MLFNNYRLRHHHTDNSSLTVSHSESKQNRDEKLLKISLVHWINQNNLKQEDYKEWAEKARSLEKEETAKNIEKAAEYIKRASEMLLEAKKDM
ncbi:MAG: zinc transporter [Peptostreptococcaceae bacterium]